MSENDKLVSLWHIIRTGEPLPLSWVVEHGNDFPRLLLDSTDPRLQLKVAGFLISEKSLVLASVAVARTVLKYCKEWEIRPLRAVEAAEEWARGEASTLALLYAADDVCDALVDLDLDDPIEAYRAARDTAYVVLQHGDRLGMSSNAANVAHESSRAIVRAFTGERLPSQSSDFSHSARMATVRADQKLAKIVREHLAKENLTIGDLVAAGKRGWL
jgi:hypothetical protein